MSHRRTFVSAAAGAALVALVFGAPEGSEASRLIQNFGTGTFSAGNRVRCDAPGGFLHWADPETSWRHNTAGQGAGKDVALKDAMKAWTDVTMADFKLTYAGTTSAGFVTDGQNTISWGTGVGCSGNCLALTALVLQPGQLMVESDITFNSAHTWTTSGTDFDTQTVATHEFGHALGIHHTEVSQDPKPTMAAVYFGPSGKSLEPDDRLALQCAQGYLTQTPLGLYQLRTDGTIQAYTGTPCSSGVCPGWRNLDFNPQSSGLVADGEHLYQIHQGGAIYRFTGFPCVGASCNGWQKLDNNSQSWSITAAGGHLYQIHDTGAVYRFTGQPCAGASCPGWERLLDPNGSNTMQLAADGDLLYMRHWDGNVWRFTGQPCGSTGCFGWQLIDNNFRAVSIVAGGGKLYQRHDNGAVFRFTGQACNNGSCPGWDLLDNNSKTVSIAANNNGLYQQHSGGVIWRYTGTPCGPNGCPGWEVLDNNPKTSTIRAKGGQLYQLHNDGGIWRFTGQPCNATGCLGWQRVGNDSSSGVIAVGR